MLSKKNALWRGKMFVKASNGCGSKVGMCGSPMRMTLFAMQMVENASVTEMQSASKMTATS